MDEAQEELKTEQTEITEQTETEFCWQLICASRNFRVFRYFRLFRILSSA